MASQFFDKIIQAKLDQRFGKNLSRREGTFRAEVESAVKVKGLSIVAQFTLNPKRLIEEEELEGIELSAEEAALAKIDEIIEGIVRVTEGGGSYKYNRKSSVKLPAGRSGLYLRGGSEIGYSKLSTLLNIKLADYVESLMGQEGRLVYRTGRLAHSAQINKITEGGSVFFHYMTAPYMVFEKSRGRTPWNKGNRDPRNLIREAIRNLLLDTLNDESASRLLGNIRYGGN